MKIEPIKIKGCGNSLWGESKGIFTVDTLKFNNFCDTEQPYELQVYGPDTEWYHYTDSRIQEEVNKELLKFVQEHYPNYTVKYVVWSEQGMQPEKGWSFDIIIEEELEYILEYNHIMKLKYNYIVAYHQDRGPCDYEFYTEKELVKEVSFYDPYVRIFKIEKELTKEDAEKLGMRIID